MMTVWVPSYVGIRNPRISLVLTILKIAMLAFMLFSFFDGQAWFYYSDISGTINLDGIQMRLTHNERRSLHDQPYCRDEGFKNYEFSTTVHESEDPESMCPQE